MKVRWFTVSVVPACIKTTASLESALALARTSVPPVMLVSPVKVPVPERVKVPAPLLVSPPLPGHRA
jgi:hypothetical protein